MDSAVIERVWRRAGSACEYCRMSQEYSLLSFEIDHITPRKHGGRTVLSNLALSCFYCNSFKGSDLTGFDPKTKRVTRLYNPRRHRWQRHFRFEGGWLIGITAIGRTTVRVLQMNLPLRVTHRVL